MANHEILVLEHFQAIVTKRLECIRKNEGESSDINRYTKFSFNSGTSIMTNLVLFSLSEAALAAVIYETNRGLDALEDIKALWTRRSCEARVRQLRITNSKLPIYRLPDEVLSLIFEPDSFGLGDAERDYDEFRDAVASVCFRVRQAILDTPSCWSNIWINAGTKVDIDTTDNSRIRTLFKRSKSAPLQLTWKVEGGFYEDIAKWRNPYAALLSQHAHRIRALAFVTSYTIDVPISLFGGASMPNLRHFRVEGKNLNLGETTLHDWVAFQAPLLTLEITDRGISGALALPSFATTFNTTALTNLALRTPIRIQDFVALLKRCPSLEVLNLECQRIEDTSDMLNSLSGHDFGHLRQLRVENGALGTILRQANTPILRELKLWGDALSFLQSQATYPNLRGLRLYGPPSVEGFRNFLVRARHVTAFAIHMRWEIVAQALECLAEKVSWGRGVSVEDGEAVDESWTHPWPHLKKLEIDGWGECPPELCVMLQYLREILRENSEVEILFHRPTYVVWRKVWREEAKTLREEYPSRISFL